MPKTINKAKRVVDSLSNGSSVNAIKDAEATNDQDWHRISAKAYELHIHNYRERRTAYEKKSNADTSILDLNNNLADYSLSISSLSTMGEVKTLQKLVVDMPINEHKVIAIIERSTMNPRIRTLQKKGRFEHFSIFKEFSKIIDAATICYYGENYISSYLTLVPVIEGILLRWLEFTGTGKKPKFEALRRFFKNSHVRQPCPENALFHKVYTRACDKLLTDHFYKPSDQGGAYSKFNRHLAAHLLSDSQFATKDNCVRLFLLIDMMTEIFYYETSCPDPRMYLENEEIAVEIENYKKLITQKDSPFIKKPEYIFIRGT